MHKIISNSNCSVFFYQILIVIEFVQFVYYSIHPSLSFYFENRYLSIIRGIIQYFQFNYLLSTSTSSLYLILLYLSFSIQFLILVMVVIILFLFIRHKKKSAGVVLILFKILGLYCLLMTTVLTLPFFNIFIVAFRCNQSLSIFQDISCYQGFHFMHLVISGFGLFFWGLISMVLLMFFHETNPISKLPFSSPLSQVFFLKLIIKMLLPLYYLIDNNVSLLMDVVLLFIVYCIMVAQKFEEILSCFFCNALLVSAH